MGIVNLLSRLKRKTITYEFSDGDTDIQIPRDFPELSAALEKEYPEMIEALNKEYPEISEALKRPV